MNELRVTLIGDDSLARAGLAALLAGREDCHVVDQVDSSPTQLRTVDLNNPDVLLWDLGWDPETGLAALADFCDGTAQTPPVLVLAPRDEDAQIARTAWRMGASGVLLRSARPGMIVAGLHAVATGLTVWDPSLTEQILPQGDDPADLLLDPLTPRELDVLQLLAEGLPNKTIARRLAISDHTVKFHVNALLSKLQAQSRTEAVVRATRAGLVTL